MNRERLEAASKQGIITTEQVESLLKFFSNDSSADITEGITGGDNSEEHLRFVRGVGDIFIMLGVIFVAVAGAQIEISAVFNLVPILILVGASEWLIRIRRLSLPGIALLISILYFSNQLIGFSLSNPELLDLGILTGVALAFYFRYKMPFTLLPIAAGCLGALSIIIGIDIRTEHYIFALFGLLVFIAAMWFDSRDKKRTTRLSDSAFWLHLLAAPLVVHGIMITLLSSDSVPFTEFFIILFFVIFFLIALFVDRRAILVSSLSYAIFAVIKLAITGKVDIENMTLIIFIAFGMFIIFFGVYWYKIRNLIFSKVGNVQIARFVPPFLPR